MLRLAAPLIATELGWMVMGIVDTMFVGRIGADAIGAVSLGTSVFYAIAICASGLLLGLDTLVAHAHGAGDHDDARHSLVSGVWLSFFLIPIVMTSVRAFIPLLGAFGIAPEILGPTEPYLRALNWSTPFLILYFGFRRYLQSIGVIRPILLALIGANLVNLAGNWILVFGNLGAPRMGAEGAGWATCISRLFMAIALGATIWLHDRGQGGGLSRVAWEPDFPRIWRLVSLGLPAAGQIGLEVSVFATVTVLMGKVSAEALAGHQIALTTISTTFMMPLGISSAAAVRVGHALGRGRFRDAARSGWTGVSLGAILMSVAACALILFPHAIARWFTPDPNIIAAAAPLLRIAAFFQLFDGCQVVVTGALRGVGDTRTPMFCHLAGYWVIGLPVGALLCFRYGFGAAGLWTGLSLGLILIGIVLVAVWRRVARGLTLRAAVQAEGMIQ